MGNRNVGSTSTTADDKIGGEGIASVILYTLGSYPTQPTVTFPAPTLPTGVTATGTVTSEVLSATIAGGAAGSGGYTAGNILTVTDSTGTATFTVATVSAGGVATVTPLDRGTFTGALTTLARTTTVAVGAGTTTGTGCTLTLIYRAKAVVITEQGSGYTSAPAGNTLTFTQSVTATSTALTVDTGAVGSATNQENAILAYAYISGALRLVDLVKQISTKRYKVRYNGTNYTARIRYDAIADGTAGYTAAEGVELNIIASDGTGTYLVRKLYNRTCTLKSLAINNSTIGITSNTAGLVVADGKQTKWTFGAATADTVQIQNA